MTYEVTVYRDPSSNANLNGLSLSVGELDPDFAAGTLSYAADVAYEVDAIAVTPTAEENQASITVNGEAAANGLPREVSLQVGENTIAVTVTAPDGTPKTYTVTVTRAPNAPPTDIDLSAASVDENTSDATVGAFSAVDPDTGEIFTYSLVDGTGSTDNGRFAISGNLLKTAEALDYEEKSVYSILVRVTDRGGLAYEETFAIQANDLNERPNDLWLSFHDVDENAEAETLIGTFSASDPDAGDTVSFFLVSGDGDADNDRVAVEEDSVTLVTATAIDYEASPTLSIRVRAVDSQGATHEEALTITVNDLNEAPTAISLSSASVNEHAAPGTGVGSFTTADADSGQ